MLLISEKTDLVEFVHTPSNEGFYGESFLPKKFVFNFNLFLFIPRAKFE
jgi:hypothetical protein